MRRLLNMSVLFVPILTVPVVMGIAQPRFAVPLTVTDGLGSEVLYIGYTPTAHRCYHPADTLDEIAECVDCLPVPPAGVFWARIASDRALPPDSVCCDQPCLVDLRPSGSPVQRDTFKLKAQFGGGASMRVSWPPGLGAHFTSLLLRYIGSSGPVTIDMLTDTLADITDAGEPAWARIYSGGLVVTSMEEKTPLRPLAFALHPNFPNPFNPTTSISYDVATRSLVSLRVYDLLGREVAVLVDQAEDPGTHTVHFDAREFGSGVYFCTLKAAAFVGTRKLILIR